MLFKYVSAPHAFGIHACICSSAEGAAEPRFFSFGPSIWAPVLEILLLGGAPASGRLEVGGIGDGARIGVVLRGKIVCVKKPLGIVGHELVGETIWVAVRVREGVEWGMDEEDIWVGGLWIHSDGGEGVWVEWARSGPVGDMERGARDGARGVGAGSERGGSGGEEVEVGGGETALEGFVDVDVGHGGGGSFVDLRGVVTERVRHVRR